MAIEIGKSVPPLKWAGGKRWLTQRYPDLFPDRCNRLIEPFLGSAAVFFFMQPKKAILSDSNPDLIEFYTVLRDDPDRLTLKLFEHAKQHSKEYYYRIRDLRPRSDIGRAARFLYLNRTCWNGLYRVNKSGDFNVPVGTKTDVVLPTDDFFRLSEVLKNATLICSDFENVIDRAGSGDFLFVDPPYTVAHNTNGFLKYNETIFNWEDQVRLSVAVRGAVARGARLLLTNAAHPSVKALYKGFTQHVIARASVISGDVRYRKRFDELIVAAPS